jgi:2-polyprenyl-6-methoxyphenol hydroxylase-like FAD-dependent oxidoreductase
VLLAGDAGSFLDPVFSTGVAIALESGMEAGQALQRCPDRGDWSGRLLRRYGHRQQARYRSYRRFVLGFYTQEFRDVFFAKDPPQRMFRSVVTVFAGLLERRRARQSVGGVVLPTG